MPLIALVSFIIFPPWALVWAWLAPMPSTVQEQMNRGVSLGFDGMIVYVDEAGKPPVSYAAGFKNRENQIPADPHSLFKIASIGKLYVAATTVKLASRQMLSLDDTISIYFPELENRIENLDKITLRHLLQHRSGIPNYTDQPAYPWGDPPKTADEALQYSLDLPASFEPGKKYSYSNTNYLLITKIIEKVTGYHHQQVIRNEILDPLGLKNTYGSLAEVNPDDIMSGYSVGWEPDVKFNNHGSMLATAEDVGIFLRALIDGTLFTNEEQQMYSSVYVYDHTGLVPGYQSIARYHEDIDAVVVQFVSTNGGHMWALSEIIYKRLVKKLERNQDI
jgi:CubicO group peptidase (beta-lactamase class C family)